MTKTGSKKERLNSLKSRVENSKIGDVTLSEFADSNVPMGKGRLRKSKNVLQEVRKISTSEDIDDEPLDDADKPELLKGKVNEFYEGQSNAEEENKNLYTEYPLKIWLLLGDYISPEDVKSFSLICKATLSVVNTPLFWIRLYKRYYNKKSVVPKCLSYSLLNYKLGLKQRVVRSLYYFYTPFVYMIKNHPISVDSAVGSVCLRHWVCSPGAKESGEESKWFYNFKFCNRNVNYIFKNKNKQPAHMNDIHYNSEKGCSLLKVVGKEFIAIPNVMGMRLKSVSTSSKFLTLTFSSAPVLRKPTDAGNLTLTLENNQRLQLIPWWHPEYWEHGKCCKRISRA